MIEKLPADVGRGECSAKSLNITSFVEDKNKAEVLWQVVSTFLILETMGGDRSHVETCDVHYLFYTHQKGYNAKNHTRYICNERQIVA